ncbi:MAG TPA: hypothetical protein VEF34_15595 [Syntrophobacteraceae bacterium]|nr:hypothetical protein [Syntrophobacteraceae bacterium]
MNYAGDWRKKISIRLFPVAFSLGRYHIRREIWILSPYFSCRGGGHHPHGIDPRRFGSVLMDELPVHGEVV